MQKITDTHIHVWDLQRAQYPWLKNDTSILKQTWHIGQLEQAKNEAAITSGILVQASGNLEDTELMLETARKTAWIAGVVCWLPLADTHATQKMLAERFLTEPYFKGVRHQVHDEKDPKWLLQPSVIASLKVLAEKNIPYDIVAVLPQHIETALEVAHKIPELKMVFDHLSQPPIKTKERFGVWGDLMKAASGHKNFYAKISGLGTTSGNFENWNAEDVKPYIAFALEHFGSNRCFCGGDWPVSLLAGSYNKVWNVYTRVINGMVNKNDSDNIFYNNAQQFYHL
jgi:L-fuconolactonase